MLSLSIVACSLAAWLTAVSLSSTGVEAASSLSTGLSNYTFPEDFIFGVSTAAYQIEGGWNEGGKGENIWDHYLHLHPNYTLDGSNGDIATDSYHKYKEDVRMLRELGVSTYRCSMSWPRLLPQGTDNHISEDGIRYYRSLFDELLTHGITPMVTLFHWDLPQVLMDLGGWNNPKMVDYFEDYARVAFQTFGDQVKIWSTMNEPHQHCYHGYGLNYFVPALLSHGLGEYLCNHYMLLAHARAYHLYDKHFRPKTGGKIGITLDSFFAEPRDAKNPEDREAVERYLQMSLGLYAHPIYSDQGDYPELVRQRIDNMSIQQGYFRSRLPRFTPSEIEELRGSSDFFGLNHYTTFVVSPSSMEPDWKVPSMDHDTGVKMSQNPAWPIPGSSWLSVYPQGFRKLLNWITRQYGRRVPIIITENGMTDSGGTEDYTRVKYYNEYLHQLLLAIHEDQCNVQGYFAWSLMDIFEWTEGYTSKFGLYEVDFESPDRTRTPKLSAKNFAEIVRTRQINYDFITPPPTNNNKL